MKPRHFPDQLQMLAFIYIPFPVIRPQGTFESSLLNGCHWKQQLLQKFQLHFQYVFVSSMTSPSFIAIEEESKSQSKFSNI